jgi:hypothetical protein
VVGNRRVWEVDTRMCIVVVGGVCRLMACMLDWWMCHLTLVDHCFTFPLPLLFRVDWDWEGESRMTS